MRKVYIIVGVLAAAWAVGLGWWWFTRMDKAHVHAFYRAQIAAAGRYDAQALCDMLHPNYKAIDITLSPSGEERLEVDRVKACEAMRNSMKMFGDIAEQTKGTPEFDYDIALVVLSEDRATARVNVQITATVGDRLKIVTAGHEVLTRRHGDVVSLGGETRTLVTLP